MEQNPLARELKSLSRKLAGLHRKRASFHADLTWHAGFDVDEAEKARARTRRTVRDLEQQASSLASKFSNATETTRRLSEKARPGWRPTYWLSDTRSQAKSELAAHRKAVGQLENQEANLRRRLNETKEDLAELEAEVQKYDDYPREAAQEELDRLDSEIPLRELELEELAGRKRTVDEQLKAPIKDMQSLKAELGALQDEIRMLDTHRTYLEQERADAERLDDQISRAATSFDRAMLHQNCENQFGESSPRAVIRDRRHAIDQTRNTIRGKYRQIAAVERKLAKVDARIKLIGERASRTIRALIIDGSNLCYEGQQFIGLAALAPLCRRLTESYEVTVVFDASIRRSLRANDSDLTHTLKEVKVHVVATRGKADETILDAAAGDAFVYVLSNDRFAEYQDKPALKDNRLIRHEIINGRVLVHDLAIDEPFFGRS